jgi:hypothetical protein
MSDDDIGLLLRLGSEKIKMIVQIVQGVFFKV